MNDSQKTLNNFLVKTFNIILRQEEKSLEKLCEGKLSVKEFHVIEAIYEGMLSDKNSMRAIADALDITMGTLTVAVKTLELKGYIKRVADEIDKRSAKLVLTHLGIEANKKHIDFHVKMIEAVSITLDKKQQELLAEAPSILENYFRNEYLNG